MQGIAIAFCVHVALAADTVTHKNITYIRNGLANYFYCQVTITIP